VFVAEDDDEMRELVALYLTEAGYEVIAVESGAVLLDLLASHLTQDGLLNVDMIITDIRMPGPTGLRVLAMLREYDRMTPIIVMTAFGGEATQAEALRLGATVVLDKPLDLDDLCDIVRQLVPVTT
jgi:CheY-like chemotaxis protein